MENPPAPDQSAATSGAPQPEVLKPREEEKPSEQPVQNPEAKRIDIKKSRRNTYRPSHKATFIGLAVVVVILVVNAIVISVVLKNKAKSDKQASEAQVTIDADALSKVGVNTASIGDTGVQLTVEPNAQFKGKLSVAGETNLSGELKLNSKLTSADASITSLQAGKTSLSQLDVNGDSTLSALNLRSTLLVTGTSKFLGAVTMNELLTVNNSINVAGNLAIGGALSTAGFVARDLTSTGTLNVIGHIVSGGSTPAVGAGGALGSNGTVAISGSDTAGTISINIGTGAVGGTLASVAFKNQFGSLPRIIITPVGIGGDFYVRNPSVGGFSVAVMSGLPPGGYSINYIVMQ